MSGKTVLVFGTFDNIHEGHRAFLRDAAGKGNRLVVSVARDAHVRTLKQKSPSISEIERLAAVKQFDVVDEAVLSDETLGTYNIIPLTKPDLIFLGHDQQTLGADLARWMEETGNYVDVEYGPKYDK